MPRVSRAFLSVAAISWALCLALAGCGEGSHTGSSKISEALAVGDGTGNTVLSSVSTDEHIEVELVSESPSLVPGKDAAIGIRFKMEKGWHVYWKNPGDSGAAPKVAWHVPAGFSVGPFEWPAPSIYPVGPFVGFVYPGEIVLPVRLRVPASLDLTPVTIGADVDWLVCEDECVGGDARLALTIPVSATGSPPDPRWASLFATAASTRPAALPDGTASAALARPFVTLTLRGKGPWAEAGAPLRWFPDEGFLFTHAALPEVERAAEETRLRLALDKASGKIPARLTGVLQVGEGEARRSYAIDVPVVVVTASGGAPGSPDDAGGSMWSMLLLAFLGGVILNVMPCVLPVLSIKVLGFVHQAGEDPKRVKRHGLAFSAGVVLSFWAIVALLLALRAAGQGLGWGFQFQEPLFTGSLCLLMFLVGLNLLGVFEWGTGIAGWAGTAEHKASASGYLGSFASGVLATVVATPCTAPFMGTAVGYALSAPPVETFAVFTALGVGMAAPYALLSAYPRWLRHVPKPGPWMETFKQALAFPMFAVVVYVGYVFAKQTGALGSTGLLASLLTLGIGAWAFGRFGTQASGPRVRAIVGIGLSLACVAASVLVLVRASSYEPGAEYEPPAAWIPWRPGIEAELRAEGRTVFVDFTADWCLTCKANDATVLSTDTVRKAARRLGVALVYGDWTRKSSALGQAISALHRESVPVYAVYPADPSKPPEVLPTVLTPGQVVEAFERAAGQGPGSRQPPVRPGN